MEVGVGHEILNMCSQNNLFTMRTNKGVSDKLLLLGQFVTKESLRGDISEVIWS